MRALFLTKYSSLGASSRYRAYQFVDLLKQAGVDVVVRPLLRDWYLQQLYAGRRGAAGQTRKSIYVAVRLAQRLAEILQTAASFDVVYLQYEALPYIPAALERALFYANPNVIVDYDDAMHLQYQEHAIPVVRKLLGPKIPWIVSSSRHVVVANNQLAEWVRHLNPNVTLIPTSVDLRRYPAPHAGAVLHDPPIIVWIGTPKTVRYVEQLIPPLRALHASHGVVLKVVGAPGFSMPGVPTISVPWSEHTEVAELRDADIGVMPLPNGNWERGKSALKLIQYMAAGVPAVASPVGANRDVVRPGENGLLAESDEEWLSALRALIEDAGLRARVQAAARATVEERFSIQTHAPRLLDLLLQYGGVEPAASTRRGGSDAVPSTDVAAYTACTTPT